MPLSYLDEPTPKAKSGLTYLDEESVSKLSFPAPDPTPEQLDEAFSSGALSDITPDQAVAIAKARNASRTDPAALAQGVGQGVVGLAEQGVGAGKEWLKYVAKNPTVLLSPANPMSPGVATDLARAGAEAGLRGSADLGQIGSDAAQSLVLDPFRVVKRAADKDGWLNTIGRVVAAAPVLNQQSPLTSPTLRLASVFPQESAEVLREGLLRDRQIAQERQKLAEGGQALTKDVATAVASALGVSPERAQAIGEAVQPPQELAQATDFASQFADPAFLASPAIKAGSRLVGAVRPVARETAEATARKAAQEAMSVPPVINGPTVSQIGQQFVEEAAKAGTKAPGVAQKGVQKAGQAAEASGQVVGRGAEAVESVLERYETPLKVISGAAGLVKGLPGAFAGAQIPGLVRKVAKYAAETSRAGTALKAIGAADWNSSIPVWRQIAKNPDAPKWLVKGVSARVAGRLTAGEAVEKGLRSGTDLAKGTLEGAATDAALTAADLDKSGQEIGQEAGGGGLFGALGTAGALKSISDARKADAFAYDAMRIASRSIEAGANPLAVASTPDSLMVTAAVLENMMRGSLSGRKDLKVDLMSGDQFRAVAANRDAAAFFDPNTGRIAVNLEAGDAAGRQLHELGHAIMASASGANPNILTHFTQLLGSEGLAKAKAEYGRATGMTTPMDDAFIVGELFSEAMANVLRGENLNEALPTVLGRTELRSFFMDPELRAALRDPSTVDLVRQQFQATQEFRPAVDIGREVGLKIRPTDAGKPMLPVENRPDGSRGNDFVDVLPTGRVVEAPAQIVRQRVRSRRKEVQTLFPDAPAATGPNTTDIGVKTTPSGETQKTGTRLGDAFYNTALSFGDGLKANLRRIEQAIASGETLAGWYQQIGDGDNWAASVRETLGAVSAQFKDFIPFSFRIDRQNNLLIQNYSLSALERKAARWAGQTGPLSLELWNGDIAAFRQDVQTYLRNHAEGRPGADGIGETKRNVINVFMVGGNRTFEAVNPLRAMARGQERQGIVRSYRADRLQTVEPSEVTGFSQPDYTKQVRNLTPEVQGLQSTEAPPSVPAHARQQENAGGRVQVGRFSIDPAVRGQEFGAAIRRTKSEHPFGFAVDDKGDEFYTNPANQLFISEDGLAGVAVTDYGDLVSVFKHPESKADIKPILAEAAQRSKTLDAFDVNGFLPNLYGQLGFRPAARVPFNREFAPPGWRYDLAGEPDVVLMVRDVNGVSGLPEVANKNYDQIKAQVPAVDYDTAVRLQQEAKDKVATADQVRNSPEVDSAYLDAVKRGDTAAAQQMVDQAAKAAGYTVGPVLHGSHTKGITKFEPGRASAIYFTDNPEYTNSYGPNKYSAYLKINKLADLTDPNSEAYKLAVQTFNERGGWSENPDAMEGRTSPDFNPETDLSWELFDNPDTDIGSALLGAGYDGVKLNEGDGQSTSIAVFQPEQIKSADPVTKDNKGNVIPLSQRFNAKKKDIRNSPEVVDSRQLELDLGKAIDGLGSIETITGGTPKGPKTFSVTANRIKKQMTQGPVNPIGLPVRSETDMHAVAALFRNPTFEATRWVFLKDNKIARVVNLTSRKANETAIFAKELPLAEIVKIGQEVGADSYFLTHNHPSGDSLPSDADRRATGQLAKLPPLAAFRFLGHIVTNHTEHHIIRADVATGATAAERIQTDPQGEDAWLERLLWDQAIDTPAAMVSVGQALASGKAADFLLLLDGKNRVRTVGELNPNATADQTAAEIRDFAKSVGAVRAVVYSTSGRPDAKARIDQLLRQGVILDGFVTGETTTAYQDYLGRGGDPVNASLVSPDSPVESQVVTTPDERLRFSPEVDYNRPSQEVMKTSAMNVLHGTSPDLPPATPDNKRTLDQIASAIQEVAIKQWGRIINSYDITPDEYRVLLDNAVNEAVAALRASGKNAFDWYTAAVERAVVVMSVIHPELRDDAAAKATGVFPDAEAAKLGMMMAMAVTSQNLSVDYNSRYAEEQFSALRNTGKFDPTKEYGTKATSISKNLELANTVIETLGWEGANTFLASSFTVAELSETASKLLGREVSIAGRVSDQVQGAAIFGPKIGQGFLQNLRGNYMPVTIDLWMRRTWGRWTGDVMEADPLTPERVARLLDTARAKKYVLPDQLKKLRTVARQRKTGSEYTTLSETLAERVRDDRELRNIILDVTSKLTSEWSSRYKSIKSFPVRPEDAQALKEGKITLDQLTDRQLAILARLDTQFARLKEKPPKGEWRKAMFAKLGHTESLGNKAISKAKPEWAKAAIIIENALGPIDVPTDQDREVITRLVNDIRGRLKEQGIETTNADIQAILWYPEKDIWAKLSDGTTDSDLKQSYDTEFLKIAEARGLGDQARAALQTFEADRTARTGRADDAGADEKVRAGAGGNPEEASGAAQVQQ